MELTELDSGVRVVTEVVPSVRSVALGMWVRTGSRDEAPAQAGVSHFLEHLLFKGTERHSAIEISELFDGMGAAANAATGKETTHLHTRFLDEHTEAAFDLMAEMLLAPALPPDEIDSEREVVLEEIAMYEDEPQEFVHDLIAEAVFGHHPLGRPVIGTLHGAQHRRRGGRPPRARADGRAGGATAHAPRGERRRRAPRR